ncbi:MAG: hypothetical protein RLZZ156_2572 [Deinococcota bacterium]|jgi:hypothetical protein
MGFMRDSDIRALLEDQLYTEHHNDPDALVLHELGVREGTARVDMAVINGFISGFEIKSEKDTLARLPWQSEMYSQTLDFVTIVCNTKHLGKITSIVPDWWGIVVVNPKSKDKLEQFRNPQQNVLQNPIAVAEFLWRDEALDILTELGCVKGVKSKPRHEVFERLVASLEFDDLKTRVRQCLKSRKNWRVDLEQTLGDEKSLFRAS